MAGTSLLFTLARQSEGKVQLAPDVFSKRAICLGSEFCEFGGFLIRCLLLSPVDDGEMFAHEAIVSISGMQLCNLDVNSCPIDSWSEIDGLSVSRFLTICLDSM